MSSAALSLLLLLAPPATAPLQDGRRVAPEEDLRRAWSFLRPEEQHEVVEWFRLETYQRDTFQMRLLKREMAILEVDAGLLHEAVEREFFDSKEHTPEKPVRRKWLAAKSPKVEEIRKDTFDQPDPRRLRSAFVYDWGAGFVRRATPLTDEEIFENGLLGYPPDADLVRELVLAKLDRGEERAGLGAFSHAYVDRKGNAYPGITLYDVWSSGKRFELPDVDALGIVHVVLDDWSSWKAPVPSARQSDLYGLVEGVFVRARRYRALREMLADLFLLSQPPPQEGYESHRDGLHALWDQNGSQPEALARALPDAAAWGDFLRDWTKLVDTNASVASQGRRRQRLLAQNQNVVREALLIVFEKYGALDRDRLPPPVPATGD